MAAKKPKFEVDSSTYFGKTTWFWRLRARNGEIIAHGESHTSERDAKRAIAGVKRNVKAILEAA